MKKIILIFGVVIGALLSTNSIIHLNIMYSNPDYQGNDLLGYATQIAMFSIIYFGIKNYRDHFLEGKISLSKAIKTGALICFVASTIYVVVGLLYYYLFIPDFMDVYTDYRIRNTAADEVEAVKLQMENFKEMYKNPLFAILISYLEVLPLGMIVVLFCAFMVKKK